MCGSLSICLSIDEWKNKLEYNIRMDFWSAKDMNKLQTCKTTGMNLDIQSKL